MRNNEHGCWYRTFHALSKEFQKEKFSLSHEPVDDFFKSQWQSSQKSYLWLFYRWVVAAFFSVGVIASLIQQWNQGRWFIYLTDWGFILCMFVNVFGAVLVTIHHCKPHQYVKNDFAIKVYWLLHWCTLVSATVITFMYWLFIFPTDSISASNVYNLWAHGFNSIFMLLDHLLVAFPTRILHFIYPLILGLIYGIFSVIYYIAGGLDIHGNRYVYKILDWSKPLWALLACFGCLTLIILFSFLLFGLYKSRQAIYSQCKNNSNLTTSNAEKQEV